MLAEAIEKYEPNKVPLKTLCHERVEAAMSAMRKNVLDNERVLKLVYRKLNLTYLFAYIARS